MILENICFSGKESSMTRVLENSLIPSCMGGAGADPPTSKKRILFLMALNLRVPTIFNKNLIGNDRWNVLNFG